VFWEYQLKWIVHPNQMLNII